MFSLCIKWSRPCPGGCLWVRESRNNWRSRHADAETWRRRVSRVGAYGAFATWTKGRYPGKRPLGIYGTCLWSGVISLQSKRVCQPSVIKSLARGQRPWVDELSPLSLSSPKINKLELVGQQRAATWITGIPVYRSTTVCRGSENILFLHGYSLFFHNYFTVIQDGWKWCTICMFNRAS